MPLIPQPITEKRCYARLRVGDTVKINSGGPDMNVVSIRGVRALCEWGEGFDWNSHIYPNICLTRQ